MKRYLAAAAAALALAVGGAVAAAPASSASASRSAVARTCGAGYVHANLSWGEKCLHAGQFCKVGNSEYRRYGFTCPSTGHLRKR